MAKSIKISLDLMNNIPEFNLPNNNYTDSIAQQSYYINKISQRLTIKLSRDELVQQVTTSLMSSLNVDRVVLYYFYSQWKGQVTFECLSNIKYTILGSTGADQCFTDEYAKMYLEGRFKVIDDIELEPISECHREFLRSIMVRANLVVPVLTKDNRLWGLLVAHSCKDVKYWTDKDVELMQKGSKILADSPSID